MLWTALFGGAYFVVVTAIEMMAFGADADAFHASPSLLGDLGTRFVGSWVGDLISLGATVSAFACCLACVTGGARLLFALGRDALGDKGIGRASAQGAPAAATVVAGVGAILLVFVQRRLRVPAWQLVFPIGALVLLGYTVYVSVIPYPESGPARFFPVVAAAVLLGGVLLVLAAPGFAHRVGRTLAATEEGAQSAGTRNTG